MKNILLLIDSGLGNWYQFSEYPGMEIYRSVSFLILVDSGLYPIGEK
jgi:hypothetical protein